MRGLVFLFGTFSNSGVAEEIYREAVHRRTSEFDCIKGNKIDWGAFLRRSRTSFYQDEGCGR